MMLPLEPCQNTKEDPHPPLSALLNLRIVPKLNAMGNQKLLNFFITSGTMPTYGGMPPSWTEYVQTILKDADRVTITDQEKVIILNLDYFEKLSQLLLRTKPRVVANYLAWQSAKTVLSYLNKDAQKIDQNYEKVRAKQSRCKLYQK